MRRHTRANALRPFPSAISRHIPSPSVAWLFMHHQPSTAQAPQDRRPRTVRGLWAGGNVSSALRLALLLAMGLGAMKGRAQAPLTLDPTFSTGLSSWYVAGLLPQSNGKVIASGQMRYQGEVLFRALMRFEPDGTLDESFYQSGLGGGGITPWQGDTFYVGTSQTVRRILPTGYRDESFIEMNSSPLFSSLQGRWPDLAREGGSTVRERAAPG